MTRLALRLLPILSEKGGDGAYPFECEPCQRRTDEGTRKAMHCGWMDHREWAEHFDFTNRASGKATMERSGYVVDITEGNVCPGWLRVQPAVQQASLAARAFEKGQLLTYFPGNQQVVNEAALVAMGAWDEYQSCEMEEMKRKG